MHVGWTCKVDFCVCRPCFAAQQRWHQGLNGMRQPLDRDDDHMRETYEVICGTRGTVAEVTERGNGIITEEAIEHASQARSKRHEVDDGAIEEQLAHMSCGSFLGFAHRVSQHLSRLVGKSWLQTPVQSAIRVQLVLQTYTEESGKPNTVWK